VRVGLMGGGHFFDFSVTTASMFDAHKELELGRGSAPLVTGDSKAGWAEQRLERALLERSALD